MKRKAIILRKGSKYNICCDVNLLDEFMDYITKDDRHRAEVKLIFDCIREGLKTKKYGDESYGTKAMKPFLNNDNDRILCAVVKRDNKKQCIVMAEFFYHKASNINDKELSNRYKIVSKYEFEIIE